MQDTLRASFLIKPLNSCAYPVVKLGLPAFFQDCSANSPVEVVTRNMGALPAEAVTLAVVMPPVFDLLDAVPPLTAQVGDTLFFNLGDMAPLASVRVLMRVKTKCDSMFDGHTLCWEAFAGLDNPCPVSSQNFSEIRVSSQCINDSIVRFTLQNIGNYFTQAPHQYMLIRNDKRIRTKSFLLEPQESIVVEQPADGATYRLEATKFDNGPLTYAFFEGCGGLTPGMVTAHWLENGPSDSDFDCRQVAVAGAVTGKTAVPAGAGVKHLIQAYNPLHYSIDFQNPGNDTVVSIVIHDELPIELDPNTFQPGFSSHPYTWEIRGEHSLEVRFLPASLPDSLTNLAASKGFFSFDISPIPNLPDGTVIENRADVIFDSSQMVTTNAALHEIGPLEASANHCLSDGIYFVNQTDVDSFPVRYPGCTVIEGSVTIEDGWGPDITNMDGLSQLTEIRGDFVLFGGLYQGNLNGLSNLTTIEGNLEIKSTEIASLQGLENVASVNYLIIYYNSQLKDLTGLNGLTKVEFLSIETNDQLESLNGLDNLTTVKTDFDIYNNWRLKSLATLDSLTTIGGSLYLTQNDSLPNLSGLNHLASVGGEMWINENDILINLQDLERLDFIGNGLTINGNNTLTSLRGLQSHLSFGGYLQITNNPLLTDCAIDAVCQYLSDNTLPPFIANNALYCNSPAEVEADCHSTPVLVEILLDNNANCQTDAADSPVGDVQILLTGNSQMNLHPTDSNGLALFKLFEIEQFLLRLPQFPTNYWAACQDEITLSPSPGQDTIKATFLLTPQSLCPELSVTLGLPSVFRSCLVNSEVLVSTQNTGDALAMGVQTAIVMPPVVELLSSTPSLAAQSGDTLFFEAGDLAPFEKATLKLTVKTKCDTFLFGQTLCWETFATLDNACPNTLPAFSEIKLSATCVSDSLLRFTIKNIGDAPTQGPHTYTIIRNESVFQTGNFNLANQQSLTVDVPADSATYRMEATKFDDGTLTATALENCGGLTPGQITAFWLEKGPLEYDFDCRQVIGSFDPNLKTAVPTGAGPNYTIAANRPIQYTIDFQNTGTDTAYRVLLRDVLPFGFDLNTFRPGFSSHPCTWEIRGDTLNVLFSPIALPDSNVNEPASHGFFSFDLDQKPDLSDGTSFQNTASIIFDFNPPIVTNTVYHTIGKLTVAADEPQRYTHLWRVAGNPTSEVATFSAITFIAGGKLFELYDASGRPVRTARFSGQAFVFHRDALPDGLYFFRIGDEQGRWFTGKIVILTP
ncbi:MAG TPA: hypothetical protein PK228_13360 [Saprospiraceae bacterium]|nr:hypothetical protein [Saprospiraceae bacterium]